MKMRLFVVVIICVISCSASYSQPPSTQSKRTVVVKGAFNALKEGDGLRISISALEYGLYSASEQKQLIIKNKAPFLMEFGPMGEPGEIFIKVDTFRNGKYLQLMLFQYLFIEPGDTLEISKRGSKILLSSSNKGLFYYRKMDSIGKALIKKRWRSMGVELKPTVADYQYLDSVTSTELSYLEKVKDSMSPKYYFLSKARSLAGNQAIKRLREQRLLNKGNYLHFQGHSYIPDSSFPDVLSIKNSLANYHDGMKDEFQHFCRTYSEYLYFSSEYSSLIKRNYERDSCIIPDSAFSPLKYYYYLRDNFSGLLREKLLVSVIYNNVNKIGDRGAIIKDALSYVKNDQFRKYLLELNTGIKGEPAYQFALPDLNGNIVRMNSLKGKVVVMDFWSTGCIPCTELHPKFQKVVDHFSDSPNVVFVSVNVNKDISKWKEGVNSGLYTSTSKPNLLNIYTEGRGHDHPMLAYHRVQGLPTLIIVNAEGYIEVNPLDPWSDGSKRLIEKISALVKLKEW